MTKKFLLIVGLFSLLTACSLPKSITTNWEGKIVYSLHSKRLSPNAKDSINYQVVFAKDSLLRIDSYTSIGKQSYLKNLTTGKAYILMSMGPKNVAISVNSDHQRKKVSGDGYVLKYKLGKKTIGTIKAENISVRDTILDTTMVMNYYPEISSKYATAFSNFPGLPVKYSIYTKGMWIQYTLKNVEKRPIDIHKFIIPKGYEKMTLDEFMKMIQH